MTEDTKEIQEFRWEDDINREPLSGGKHHFAHLKMYIEAVTKVFQAGKFITIPGIAGGDFNEKDSKGNMKFGGWLKGGNVNLYVLVAVKTNQEGNEYQIVKQFPSRISRPKDVQRWIDFQQPQLVKMSDADRGKLTGEGVFVEFDDLPTGETFGDNEIMFWGNFVVHSSKEALVKAEAAFFAQFNGGNTVEPASDHYPQSWASDIQGMLEYVQQLAGEGKPPKEIAESTMLFENGNPAIAISGGEVNVKAVLSEILDIPEPMIELE